MDCPLKLKLKIGQIEFEAEGSPEDVNFQRCEFMDKLLPAAVEAMTRTNGILAERPFLNAAEVEALPVSKRTLLLEEAQENQAAVQLSINEFLNQKGFSSQIDTAIGLVYYNETFCGCIDFSSEELKRYFKDAKIKTPGNPSDVIAKLIGKSYIMAADEKGRYKLTRTGISFVESYVKKAAKEKKPKSSRRNPKTPSQYASITADDLHLNKYPEVKRLDNFKDQMMLAMFIVASEGHGDSFSVQDVQCVMTDILGLPATKGQVQGVFDRNVTWFADAENPENKKMIKHRLLTGAKDYVEILIANKREHESDGE